jgi:thiol-disulfide isomerase/thioredoxin
MELIKKYIPYLLIGGAIAVFYFWRYRTVPTMDFSEVILKDEAGLSIKLNEELHDSTVVHFYASWCGPCLKELRELNNHFSQYSQSGIDFMLITDDNEESLKAIRDKMPEDIRFYQTDKLQNLGIYTIPASYFVLDGKITHKQVNPINWTDKNQVIKYFTE